MLNLHIYFSFYNATQLPDHDQPGGGGMVGKEMTDMQGSLSKALRPENSSILVCRCLVVFHRREECVGPQSK